MAALDEHRRAGRLDADEYHDRSATAATARVRSALDTLFDDLPAPHPAYPPVGDAGDPDGPRPDGAPTGSADTGTRPTGTPSTSRPGGADRSPGADAGRPDAGRPDAGRPDDLPELVAPLGAVLGRNAGKLSVFVPVVVIVLEALIGFRFPLGLILIPLALAGLGWLGHRYGG